MHTAVLVLALAWHAFAPLCVTPGMTPDQVEALLGKPNGNIGIGPFAQHVSVIYYRYPGFHLCYGPDGRVESVSYSPFRHDP